MNTIDILGELNEAYRKGKPVVPDATYDALLERAKATPEGRAYAETLEVEPVGKDYVTHSQPMKSTQKAYTAEDVAAFAAAAVDAGGEGVRFSVRPKLDGIAAFWNGKTLATRGNGLIGDNITGLIDVGLQIEKEAEGAGEIVVEQPYFDEVLKPYYEFDHPRNFVAGLKNAGTLKPYHTAALAGGHVKLVNFDRLPTQVVSADELVCRWSEMLDWAAKATDFLTDGAVVSVLDDGVREAMGGNSHHDNWMLALKRQGETAITVVTDVDMATGRTGRITPTMELAPVFLSGASVSRCTAHHARRAIDEHIGPGAKVEIVRQGEVIPYLLRVVEPSRTPVAVDQCPSCGGPTEWDGPYLMCPNTASCPAQQSTALEHFLNRLDVKEFGPSVCSSLVSAGHHRGLDVLRLTKEDFVAAGISPGTAVRLVESIKTAKSRALADTHASAAFGFRFLGRGVSRKIFEQYSWRTIGALSCSAVQGIKGLGETTAACIVPNLQTVQDGIAELVAQGFSVTETVRLGEVAETPIKGKKVVFTGEMSLGRDGMEREAREMGAVVQASVSKVTDYLIAGAKAGSKVAKARDLGIKVLSESEYRAMLWG